MAYRLDENALKVCICTCVHLETNNLAPLRISILLCVVVVVVILIYAIHVHSLCQHLFVFVYRNSYPCLKRNV